MRESRSKITDAASPGGRVVARCVFAAAVGVGVVLVWWAVFLLNPRLPATMVDEPSCDGALECSGGSLGAIMVDLLLTVLVMVMSSVVASWPVLWLLRVRPSWPVALLGPVSALALYAVVPDPDRARSPGVVSFVVAVAGGYAIAAFVTTSGVSPRWRAAAGVALAIAALVSAVVRR
jgi:hypothetical protein